MIPGLTSAMLIAADSSAPSGAVFTGWTVGLSTSTDAASYSFTASLPDVTGQVIVVAVFGERTFGQSGSVTGVTGNSGGVSGTAICALGSTRYPIAVYYLTGITGSSTDIGATFSNTQIECAIAYGVVTGTDETTYHSRSGATPDAIGATSVTSSPITIPTGGVGIAVARVLVNNDQTWSQNSGTGSEDFDQALGSTGLRITGYHTTNAAATTFTVASSSANRQIAAFSWGP